MSKLKDLTELLCHDFELLIDLIDNPHKGMQVPYHGKWYNVSKMPAAMNEIRWYARELRKALNEDCDTCYGDKFIMMMSGKISCPDCS